MTWPLYSFDAIVDVCLTPNLIALSVTPTAWKSYWSEAIMRRSCVLSTILSKLGQVVHTTRYCGSESRTVEFVDAGKIDKPIQQTRALFSTKMTFDGKVGECMRESCIIPRLGLVVTRGKARLGYKSRHK